jgi:two-component system response regulator LytT
MPGLDGLGVVRRLKDERHRPAAYRFSTAYEQFAVEAFRLEAMDYITKPVERERLEETIERARRWLTDRITEPLPVAARARGIHQTAGAERVRNLIVDPQELIYATIDGGVITLVTAQAEGQSSFRTLEDLQAALDPDLFWRAHRSYVVNVNRIREVMPWFKSTYQLKMDDKKGSEIPVSRMQSRRLREMLNCPV